SANMSEIVLSELACADLKEIKKPKVLVGGLGMAFTLKAALDNLPADAEVVVAELNPIMVTWCQRPIAQLTGGAVDDPRVTVVIGGCGRGHWRGGNQGQGQALRCHNP
ncbi:MAG: hypothetical protein ACYC9M_16245, partial [Desulfobulbaceae bacterium]